jgi:putative two-component system response regulator
MHENLLIQDLSVRALACLAEARDNETGHHIVRTQHYVKVLAEHLRLTTGYQSALAGNRIDMVIKAAPLHDIGKVGIPDLILLKPGKLTAHEFDIMKTHPTIGAQAIDRALAQSLSGDVSVAKSSDSAFSFMDVAREITLHHHEKWDGSGYPAALSGEAIPVSARLMALADVFDALISRRVYKPAMSLAQASRIIQDGSGKHFDPMVVKAFLDCQNDFAAIAARYPDAGSDES